MLGRNYEEDSISVFWYVWLAIALIIGCILNPNLGLNNGLYMRVLELCTDISSLFGIGVLGGIIQLERVLKKHHDISLYATLLFLLWFLGIVISFAAGIKIRTNMNAQTEIPKLEKGKTISGAEICIIISSTYVTVCILPDEEQEFKIEDEYIIESVSFETATIFEKIKEFPVWILRKIIIGDTVSNVKICLRRVKKQIDTDSNPMGGSGGLSQTEGRTNSKIADNELLVGVRDILASWGNHLAYFKNPYSRQGEIRYKKKEQSEWSGWEKIDEEDIRVRLPENTQYTFAWRVGESEVVSDYNSSNNQKMLLFYNIGEMYYLNNKVLKDLMEKSQIENVLDKWKISAEFLVSDPQNSEKVEGDLLGLTGELDISETNVNSQIRLKTQDDILVYCEVDGNKKGYYCAYQGGPMKGTGGTEHKINWISASESDKSNARMIVKLFFKEMP